MTVTYVFYHPFDHVNSQLGFALRSTASQRRRNSLLDGLATLKTCKNLQFSFPSTLHLLNPCFALCLIHPTCPSPQKKKKFQEFS
jgi:hypothetical protein